MYAHFLSCKGTKPYSRNLYLDHGLSPDLYISRVRLDYLQQFFMIAARMKIISLFFHGLLLSLAESVNDIDIIVL